MSKVHVKTGDTVKIISGKYYENIYRFTHNEFKTI